MIFSLTGWLKKINNVGSVQGSENNQLINYEYFQISKTIIIIIVMRIIQITITIVYTVL